ncbi:MAG: hypothetical protein ACFFHD_05410 [Promethearchaeota archaeon]
MSKNRDALRFFQNFIREMIDIGGPNLPKSISASLGAKLGKIYKERGISGIENGLTRIYNGLNAKPKIESIGDNILEIIVTYPKRFCPIGGYNNPKWAKVIQETICLPYTIAILNTLNSDLKYSIEGRDCILTSNNKTCHYILKIEEKKSNAS